MKRNNLVIISTILVFIGTSLAACGTPTTVSNSSNAGSNNVESNTKSDSINIAVAAPFTGGSSFIGPLFLNGPKVAAEQINKHGGVLGKKINIITVDTAGDPVDALPAITKSLATQHPAAIIGPSSLTIGSVVNFINQNHVVEVTLAGTTQLDDMNYPYVFRTTPSDSAEGVAMAYYGIQKEYKKAALVFTQDQAAQTLVSPIKSTLEKHGVIIVNETKLVGGQTSYRSEIERILQSHPDSIYMQMDVITSGTFFSEWKQLGGGDAPLIGSDGSTAADFLQAMTPEVAAKRLVGIQPSTSGGPAITEFNQFYEEVFPGKKPINLTPSGYDALNLIALAMTAAKSTDPQKYVSYMTEVSNSPGDKVYDYESGVAKLAAGQKINYEGAGGSCDFDQHHNVTGDFDVLKPEINGKVDTVGQIPEKSLAGF